VTLTLTLDRVEVTLVRICGRGLPTYQIRWKSEKLFVDVRTDTPEFQSTRSSPRRWPKNGGGIDGGGLLIGLDGVAPTIIVGVLPLVILPSTIKSCQWANEQMIKFWWGSGSPSGYRDCFPNSSSLGDTESGINCMMLQCTACTSRHHHSNYDIITSPALCGGMHCPSASSSYQYFYLAFAVTNTNDTTHQKQSIFGITVCMTEFQFCT